MRDLSRWNYPAIDLRRVSALPRRDREALLERSPEAAPEFKVPARIVGRRAIRQVVHHGEHRFLALGECARAVHDVNGFVEAGAAPRTIQPGLVVSDELGFQPDLVHLPAEALVHVGADVETQPAVRCCFGDSERLAEAVSEHPLGLAWQLSQSRWKANDPHPPLHRFPRAILSGHGDWSFLPRAGDNRLVFPSQIRPLPSEAVAPG